MINKVIQKLKDFTILYVEDDANTRESISMILKPLFKEVYIAKDGIEGLELYKNNPDIVLTDIKMPNMDGIEMSRKIKQKNPEQIILFFTAFDDKSYFLDAIDIGINGYVFKPLDESLFFHTLIESANKVSLQKKKKELQNKLEHLASYDALTNLLNRRVFVEILEKLMHRSDRTNEKIALLFIDVDDFKKVNDTYGHKAGDIVLKNIATTLTNIAREEDIVSRISGDEFAMILWGLKNEDDIYVILNRILNEIKKDIIYENNKIKISLSIGITLYPQDKQIGATALLRQADNAMYKSKKSGKGKYSFFSEYIENINKEVLEIQEALSNKEFELYYQAQSDIKSGEIIGFEALIRWNHPTKGILTPNKFLPFIENNELLMKDFSKYVLDKAFSDIEIYNKTKTTLKFSINITSYDMQSLTFISYLKELFEKYEVLPNQIVLEIIESSAINNILVAKQVFEEIQKLGVKMAIDDFGTGYSSLIYLQQLSINIIKIDTSFIFNLLKDKKSYEIVRVSLALADAFGYVVVAEGVENEEICKELKKLGCDIAQGYFISKPIPFKKLIGENV